jgi:hypothetical protein
MGQWANVWILAFAGITSNPEETITLVVLLLFELLLVKDPIIYVSLSSPQLVSVMRSVSSLGSVVCNPEGMLSLAFPVILRPLST